MKCVLNNKLILFFLLIDIMSEGLTKHKAFFHKNNCRVTYTGRQIRLKKKYQEVSSQYLK